MSHTWKHGETTFIGNADLSGSVKVVTDRFDEVEIPFSDLLQFAAEAPPLRRCETCEHWGDPSATAEFRACQAVAFDESRQVDDPGPYSSEVRAGWEPSPEAAAFRRGHRAIVQDSIGYAAVLVTRRDFGCVLHEAKP